jgi:hypothetical protein
MFPENVAKNGFIRELRDAYMCKKKKHSLSVQTTLTMPIAITSSSVICTLTVGTSSGKLLTDLSGYI